MMFDFSKWETWVVLTAIVLGVIASLFVFKQEKQDVRLLDELTVEENEVIVIYIADSIDNAEKVLRAEYPMDTWAIIERYYDVKTKKALFRLRKVK